MTRVDLRDALSRARKENKAVRKEGVRITANGGTREVDMEVIPLRGQSAADRFYIIAFQDAARPVSSTAAGARRLEKRTEKGRAWHELARTNQEVARLRDQLHTLIDEHETTLEEFKSANAEILSANEELQSTNEELETSREELQSLNEELTALNSQLQETLSEHQAIANDLENTLNSADVATLFLDEHFRIRFFTPAMDQQLRYRRALERDLRSAIANGELFLEYQPQRHSNGAIIGFEALVRWQHPQRGTVPPAA